jgi:hypothetical protein
MSRVDCKNYLKKEPRGVFILLMSLEPEVNCSFLARAGFKLQGT